MLEFEESIEVAGAGGRELQVGGGRAGAPLGEAGLGLDGDPVEGRQGRGQVEGGLGLHQALGVEGMVHHLENALGEGAAVLEVAANVGHPLELFALALEAAVVLATQARVALGDEIGEILGAEIVVVLIGERPGLSAPDSMSAYLTWHPKVGRTDVERNCISNIRLEGLTYAESAQKLAWLIRQAKALGKTGVELKEESDS